MQTQHTCILLEDITAACNLTCPTCFADSSPARAGVVPVERRAGEHRPAPGARERPHRRADVERRRADDPPASSTEIVEERRSSRDIVRILHQQNGIRIAKDDALAALPREAQPARRGLPAVRRLPAGDAPAPSRRRSAAHQARRDASGSERRRRLHDADDDRGARRERRRDRRRDALALGHAVRRRRVDPAAVRLGPLRRDRSARSADAYRRARAARAADRWPRHLARPDRAPVLAPALLQRRLHASRRQGRVDVAPRASSATSGSRASRSRQPIASPTDASSPRSFARSSKSRCSDC